MKTDYELATAELHRIVDVGEFVISADTIKELQILFGKLSLLGKADHYIDNVIEIGEAIDGCLARVRKLAKDDLNPGLVKSARRFIRGNR
jgi:hypothetical protein